VNLAQSLGEKAAWENRTSIYLLSSALAEFIADLFLCPLEAVRIRSVSDKAFPRSLSAGFVKMYQLEGVGGFYRGIVPILFKQVPYTMAKFAVQGRAAEVIYSSVGSTPEKMTGSQNVAVSLVSGVIAGVAAAIISHPADTLLSKVNKAGAGGSGSMFSRLSNIAREIGFFKLATVGLGPRCVMVGTLTAGQFGIFDYVLILTGAKRYHFHAREFRPAPPPWRFATDDRLAQPRSTESAPREGGGGAGAVRLGWWRWAVITAARVSRTSTPSFSPPPLLLPPSAEIRCATTPQALFGFGCSCSCVCCACACACAPLLASPSAAPTCLASCAWCCSIICRHRTIHGCLGTSGSASRSSDLWRSSRDTKSLASGATKGGKWRSTTTMRRYVLRAFSASNGGWPTRNSYVSTPSAQLSTLLVCARFSIISGLR